MPPACVVRPTPPRSFSASPQIIDYAASPDFKWLMVVGIKAGAAGGPAEGAMQLYSVEKKVSQPLASHAGCFHVSNRLPGRTDTAILFCFVEHKAGEKPKLMVIEVGKDRSAPGGVFRLAPQELPVPADAGADFAVTMQASKKHDVVYILTKLGYAYVYDVPSGGVIFRHKVSDMPIFTSVVHEASGGVLAVAARTGAVLLLTLNPATLVAYVTNTLRNQALAMSLAGRLGLGGADELYVSEFNRLLGAGDYEGAAKCAAASPGGLLRTAATIARFQACAAPEGGQPPVLKYFSTLMEAGRLNKVESLELARPALAQGRVQLLEKWLAEDKISCSEQLGDVVMPINAAIALSVYLRAGDAHEKVVQAYLATGDYAKVVPYCAKAGYKPNFIFILQVRMEGGRGGAPFFFARLFCFFTPARSLPPARRRRAEPRARQRQGGAGVCGAAGQGRGRRARRGARRHRRLHAVFAAARVHGLPRRRARRQQARRGLPADQGARDELAGRRAAGGQRHPRLGHVLAL
jgi:clathrin heavy chain